MAVSRRIRGMERMVAVAVLLAAAAGPATAQTSVFPGNPFWTSDDRGAGFLAITGANPRSGNGSLELTTSGSLTDWAFYRRTAGDSLSSSWGFLATIDRLSFDWYREDLTPTLLDIPWLAQTPVLRLFLRQGDGLAAVFSELVWEKYYTDSSPATTNTWVVENLTDQYFWRFVQGASGGYTIGDCSNVEVFFPNPLKTAYPTAWADGANCFPRDVVVWGVSVGVGSNWPDQYHGYVDNVQLGFANQQSPAVYDNFELAVVVSPVPEPATILLTCTGLLGLAGAGWIRRRRTSARR